MPKDEPDAVDAAQLTMIEKDELAMILLWAKVGLANYVKACSTMPIDRKEILALTNRALTSVGVPQLAKTREGFVNHSSTLLTKHSDQMDDGDLPTSVTEN